MIKSSDRKEIFKMAFQGKIYPTVNKIYRAALLKSHRFTEGIYFEDLTFTLDVLDKSKGVLLSNLGIYHYRMEDVTTQSSRNSPKKWQDLFCGRTAYLLAALKETPDLYGCHFGILQELFQMYTEHSECRMVYKEKGYKVLDLFPQLYKKSGASDITIVYYYIYHILGYTLFQRFIHARKTIHHALSTAMHHIKKK